MNENRVPCGHCHEMILPDEMNLVDIKGSHMAVWCTKCVKRADASTPIGPGLWYEIVDDEQGPVFTKDQQLLIDQGICPSCHEDIVIPHGAHKEGCLHPDLWVETRWFMGGPIEDE